MTDIVGSTEHAAELGDSAWRELVQLHHAAIRAALRHHGGREIDTAGDGFFVVFDAPAAAVRCALQIADEIRHLGVEVRVGVHVGEVEQIGTKVGGISVVIASRIMSTAGPSEVLVSSTVRDLVAGSRLTFEDRGVSQLKGVPGDWHIYAVGRAEAEAAESDGAAIAHERRASAVRRAGARPIWQRRPRLVAAVVVGLAAVVATAGLLAWKPWQPAALAAVAENSIGIIDPNRTEVIAEIPVGTRPGGIAVGDGYAWVTNTGADSVSQIDLRKRSVALRIDVGRAPRGIAVAEGSVWVANSGDRTVSRINVATARVVQTIVVGNGPTAIVASGTSVWVANATDSTVVLIDARSGTAGQPVGVAATPIALAMDDGGLWVASEDGASISHLDPVTGVTLAAPIQLAARPSSIALTAAWVWVASTDGTVTQIERSSNRVIATIDVGKALTAIAATGEAIWVGDNEGIVYRLDPANPALAPRQIATSSAVASLAVVDSAVWLAAQPSAASHRGGTLRIVQWFPGGGRFDTDPLNDPYSNPALLEADGLVGYRHVGGTAGSALLPDLATSVPRPTNGGRTYTFQLRPGLVYSTGEPVRASDVRRGIERSFQVVGHDFWGPLLFPAILGADGCAVNYPEPVDRCDLSAGIVSDDVANTVTFNLSKPDADFVYKLAHPAAYPVPEGVPMNRLLDGEAFPGTGPYVVSAATANEVRLARNPRFHLWDAAVRPDGFPDEIVFTVVADEAQPISMVERGDADYKALGCCATISASERMRLKTQYAGQWHVGTTGTNYFAMNTSLAPFDNLFARKAINFAIDRGQMAEIAGDYVVTCQLLPPGFPGYRPYCPYTVRPDPGGQWTAPDMQKARELVDESATRGARVLVGATGRVLQRDYLVLLLEDLGYQVSIDTRDPFAEGFQPDPRAQITIGAFGPDYVAPSTFLGLFNCYESPNVVINYCDADFGAAFDHALELQATDPAAALGEWAELDRLGVDLALMAPVFNVGAHFVSARVGNYQFSPAGTVLFDQMWVQ
jgi:YVTN family beta-propeller protein